MTVATTPGGAIDEGIARDALTEAIFETFDPNAEFTGITLDLAKNLLTVFVNKSIQLRILNDIGLKVLKLPESEQQVAEIQQQVFEFIEGITLDSVNETLNRQGSGMSPTELANDLYVRAFGLLEGLAAE
jgi:hypothetical protein